MKTNAAGYTQWRRYRGGEGAAAPHDSRFERYGALVHQVA